MISLVKKTILGLSKTRSKVGKVIARYSRKSFLAESDLKHLEETLLSSDLGWALTEQIIDSIKL